MNYDLNRLIDTFNRMEKDGFNTNEVLNWGFFFLDTNKANLLKVYKELESHDYHLLELAQTNDNLWQLYITKKEVMTPEKLHKRNNAFNKLAEFCNVSLYDGWDVEMV